MNPIYKDIEEWRQRVSKPIDGYQICPYARQAKYHVFPNEDYLSLQVKALNWVWDVDLLVCIPTDKFMTVERAKYIEADCNRIATDTVVLLDHPKDPGYIDRV